MLTTDMQQPPIQPLPADRRSAPRFAYRTSLQFVNSGGMVCGVVKNLSPDGLFVEIDEPFCIGTRLDLNFILRSSKHPVSLTVEVVRKAPGGFGLKFV